MTPKAPATLARPDFDWALIRRFVAVLDAGSLSAAARALDTHQGTLSRQIVELESQLGGPLFERTGRGLTPTALARAISDAARQMETGASALSRSIMQSTSKTRGSVRITASRPVATWLMPSVLTRLTMAHPEVSVELVASDGLTNLLRREADIAVRMTRPAQTSLIARKLADLPFAIAAHKDYLAQMGTPRSMDELLTHRLVGFDRRTDILDSFAAWGLRLTPEQFHVRTDDHVVYARLVQEGAGIGFLTFYHLRRLPGLVQVLPQTKLHSLACWLAVHREIRGDPLIRKVYDFLGPALLAALKA